MNVKVQLRNIKCVFIVQNSLDFIRVQFQLHKKNHTYKFNDNKICLTIYPKSSFKIHATGISSLLDLNCILSFFDLNNVIVNNVRINNSFWMIKPLIIKNFDKFAIFCNNQKYNEVTLDTSHFGLNGDAGFLNAIFLRHSGYHGTVIIHRTCSLILGPTNTSALNVLICDLENLLSVYESCLNSS